ncbi:hypothetical protein [Nocardioides sp. W7]|uniref:hypothetical protein n=1 Tax=Nocardioides sp. W7 TaxID=2931390 RepID=UPI001FD3F2FE|nr:hypothetical protein [Nocardioides sp. W7]
MTLPLVFFLVVAAVGIVGYVAEQRRRAAIVAHATDREWTYLDEDPSLVHRYPGPPFDQGHDPEVTNVVRGRYDGRELLAFDHTYETSTGSGSDRTTSRHEHSVVAVPLGATFPSLSVAPEGFLSRIFSGFFGADLVTGDPVFDDAFRVGAGDPSYAATVLTPEVRAALLRRPDLTWRIEGESLLAIRTGHHGAEEIEPTLQALQAVILAIPDAAWAQVRGDV